MIAFLEASNNSVIARAQPAVVRLPPKPGLAPSPAPPVRIFLGTETAQYQAERIFVYAIERVRDPGRAYEIHLMKDLAGFNRRWWRTGFTNYRFAIPDYAGRCGKAIYNDVDQVYTADPALLFDLDMHDHGYLAVSPADTSVMLIDCRRMARWWNHAAASRRHKHRLTRGPAREPGLWGALDPGWNARDTEYVEGQSRLLHFTALHTQPWQPTPEQYSYRPHPLGEVWHRLKRAADEQGYTVFTPDQPSPGFSLLPARLDGGAGPADDPPPWSATVQQQLQEADSSDCMHFGVGPAAGHDHGACDRYVDITAKSWPPGCTDIVLARGCLEQLPADDVPWVLRELFQRTRRRLCIAVRCAPDRHNPAEPSDAVQCRRSPRWWREQVMAAARRSPQVHWHLDLLLPSGHDHPLVSCASVTPDAGKSKTVLLVEGDPATDAAGRRLAEVLVEVLGGPWEERPATGGAAPPGDVDMIVTAGPRGACAARQWGRPHGGARLVHLGRPGAPLSDFDLVISRPQDQLPMRHNVLYLSRPLSPVDSATLEQAARRLQPGLEPLPRPWVGVLAGGGDLPGNLDPDSAQELGRLASEQLRDTGGSLIVAPWPGLPAEAVEALYAAVDHPVYRPAAGGADAAATYHGCLALADRFIVTSDSADAVAAACARQRPVAVFELAPFFDRRSRWTQRCRRLLDSSIRHTSHRGTPRQQDWRGRILDWLITSGRLTSTHDPRALLDACLQAGLVTRLGGAATGAVRAPAPPPPEDLIASRIRQLLSAQCT